MPKQCPECHKFMRRLTGFPLGVPGPWAAFRCADEWCYRHDALLPAPEYDWEYYGLSNGEIEALRGESTELAEGIERERDAFQVMVQERRSKVF